MLPALGCMKHPTTENTIVHLRMRKSQVSFYCLTYHEIMRRADAEYIPSSSILKEALSWSLHEEFLHEGPEDIEGMSLYTIDSGPAMYVNLWIKESWDDSDAPEKENVGKITFDQWEGHKMAILELKDSAFLESIVATVRLHFVAKEISRNGVRVGQKRSF